MQITIKMEAMMQMMLSEYMITVEIKMGSTSYSTHPSST